MNFFVVIMLTCHMLKTNSKALVWKGIERSGLMESEWASEAIMNELFVLKAQEVTLG